MARDMRNLIQKEYIILMVILLFGFTLRCIYYSEISHSCYYPVQDAEFHHYWARAMVSGDWSVPDGYQDPDIPNRPFFRPPLYAFFLSLIYSIFGIHFKAAIAVQMLLGLLNTVLVFSLCRRLWGSLSAMMSALLMTSYWGFIYFESQLLDVTLHITLLLLLFNATAIWQKRQTLLNAFMMGALIGLSSLCRPNSMILIPVYLVWMVLYLLKLHVSRPQLMYTALAFIMACFAVIAPVTLRNYIKSGEPVLISANAGLMFYIGNGKNADGSTQTSGLNELQPYKYRSCFDYDHFVEGLGRSLQGPVNYSTASFYLLKKGFVELAAKPGRAFKLYLRKCVLLLGASEHSHNGSIHFHREASSLLKGLPVEFIHILAGGIVGLLVCIQYGRNKSYGQVNPYFTWLFFLVSLAYTISIILFAVSTQYRVPLIVLMLIFTGNLIAMIIHMLEKQAYRALAVTVSLFFLMFFCVSLIPGQDPPREQWLYEQAYCQEKNGNMTAAVEHLREITEMNPRHAWAWGQLGIYMVNESHYINAVSSLKKALSLEPDYPRARWALARAYTAMGYRDRAIEQYSIYLQYNADNDKVRAELSALINGL